MLRGLRILVVDDERGVRLLLTRLLEEAGATVRAVASPTEGFAEFERAAPDILVSDIRMPGGDGYELIRRVRALPVERGGRTPAVAVSASVGNDEIPKILAAGFQRFVRKPFEAAEVRDAIAAIMGRQGAGAP
jgi:CheY-like chemotaxis protein